MHQHFSEHTKLNNGYVTLAMIPYIVETSHPREYPGTLKMLIRRGILIFLKIDSPSLSPDVANTTRTGNTLKRV